MIISEFRGEYRFLSNFWPATVVMDGLIYKSVEHAYQAAKTFDGLERVKISSLANPADARRYGRHLKSRRSDWDDARLEIMKSLVGQKFATHPWLRGRLLATGDAELIEGNTWNDQFWGVCRGEGENHLGKILMQVRKELEHQRMFGL